MKDQKEDECHGHLFGHVYPRRSQKDEQNIDVNPNQLYDLSPYHDGNDHESMMDEDEEVQVKWTFLLHCGKNRGIVLNIPLIDAMS